MSAPMTPQAAIAWLNEAAIYFERRPKNGEDMAHWSNVYNAENCRKIAVLLGSTAAADVLAERRRQIEAEVWTPDHDDEHHLGEMAKAAACYAVGTRALTDGVSARMLWPWGHQWWKPDSRRRELVKAGALIIAEIERLDRATNTATSAVEASDSDLATDLQQQTPSEDSREAK